MKLFIWSSEYELFGMAGETKETVIEKMKSIPTGDFTIADATGFVKEPWKLTNGEWLEVFNIIENTEPTVIDLSKPFYLSHSNE